MCVNEYCDFTSKHRNTSDKHPPLHLRSRTSLINESFVKMTFVIMNIHEYHCIFNPCDKYKLWRADYAEEQHRSFMQKLISCKATIGFTLKYYTSFRKKHFICRSHTCACAHAYNTREPAGVFMLPWGQTVESTSKKTLDFLFVFTLQQHKMKLLSSIRFHVRVFTG